MKHTLTVSLDLLDAAVGRPAAVSLMILLLQRRTDAPLDRMQPEHTQGHMTDQLTMCSVSGRDARTHRLVAMAAAL